MTDRPPPRVNESLRRRMREVPCPPLAPARPPVVAGDWVKAEQRRLDRMAARVRAREREA